MCALGIPVDPEVNHRDETCWQGVAFRTAISIELTMSEGVSPSQPLRLISTHFRMASNFLQGYTRYFNVRSPIGR